jgi:5'-3' exonuclease
MKNNDELILIVDGLNLFTRHFVAHPATSENGEHVGGIIGFLYAISNFSEMYRPSKIIVAWEGGGSIRKRSILKEYKAHRRPQRLNRFYEDDIPTTIENRNSQVSLIVKILKNLPVIQVYTPDCEADDVIGYICKYKFKDSKKVIVSSDKDFYQLLNNKTVIYSPTWKKIVTSIQVKEKFKISPENFCLAKAICGDASDNIPGVKSVGFKSLAKRFPLLREDNYMSLDSLIGTCHNEINEGTKVKIFKLILESEIDIKRNIRLIMLDTQNIAHKQIKDIEEIIDTFSPSRNKMNILRILLKEGINTFNVDRLFLSTAHIR